MHAYELRRGRKSGEVWAVRLVDGSVVGCCDPHAPDDPDLRPSGLDFPPEEVDRLEREHQARELVEPTAV